MAVAISQAANPAGAGSGTTITYSAASIGAAAVDRYVVVCVGGELTSATIDSATINYGTGAIAMSSTTLATQGVVYARIFYLPCPTGTTADIAVTFGASQGSTTHHIAVYRVVGGALALQGSGSNNSTDMDSTAPLTTGSITIPSNGGFIAVAASATDTTTKTWANATSDIDADAGTFRFSTATRTTSLAATAVTCTGSTNGEDGGLAWISFKPGTFVAAGAGSYSLSGTAAGVAYRATAPNPGGIATSAIATTPIAALTFNHQYVTASAGSYSLSGTDATPKHAWKVAAGAGAYTLTGTAATLRHAWKAVAGAGSYSLTGTDAAAKHGWKLAAGAGSYAIAGTDAAIRHAWKVSAGAGSYALSGTAATLRRNVPVVAGAGSYALSGVAASVLHAWRVTAGAGSYALSGTDATLPRARKMVAGAGSYALTGTNANVYHGWRVSAGVGSYALTGQTATIATASAKAIGAEAGAYSLNGSDASIRTTRIVSADSGSYSLSGTDATITAGAAQQAPTGVASGRKKRSHKSLYRTFAELAEELKRRDPPEESAPELVPVQPVKPLDPIAAQVAQITQDAIAAALIEQKQIERAELERVAQIQRDEDDAIALLLLS